MTWSRAGLCFICPSQKTAEMMAAALLVACLAQLALAYPKTVLSNRMLNVTVYLPSTAGYYNSTRFDPQKDILVTTLHGLSKLVRNRWAQKYHGHHRHKWLWKDRIEMLVFFFLCVLDLWCSTTFHSLLICQCSGLGEYDWRGEDGEERILQCTLEDALGPQLGQGSWS